MINKVKLNIAILIGDLNNQGILSLFDELAIHHNITCYTYYTQNVVINNKNIKLMLLNEEKERPGYLDILSTELNDIDLLISLEDYTLSSMQALKISQDKNIPLWVIINKFIPYFYDSDKTTKALQTNIQQNASMLFATSRKANNRLLLEGVDKNKISLISQPIDINKFNKDLQKRDKFKKYIGLKETDFLVLIEGDLEVDQSPFKVLEIVKLIQLQCKQEYKNIKFLFKGNGSLAKQLKYKCVDINIGDAVLFLHQNTNDFIADLYNATDIILQPNDLFLSNNLDYPKYLLEVMATGTAVIAIKDTIYSELAQDNQLLSNTADINELASLVISIIRDKSKLNDLKNQAIKTVHRNYVSSVSSNNLSDKLKTLQSINNSKSKKRSNTCKAKLNVIRANEYFQNNQHQKSRDTYLLALLDDPKSLEANNGLGYLAVLEHAHIEALSYFKKSLAINSSDTKTNIGIGIVYQHLYLYEEALFWFEKALLNGNPSFELTSCIIQTAQKVNNTVRGISVLKHLLEYSHKDDSRILLALNRLELTAS